MKAIRILTTCLAFVLAAPTLAFSAAATCDDFAQCDGNCEDDDVFLGITLGAVDGIGELLCFVGDPKCDCFTRITERDSESGDFEQFFQQLMNGVNACAGTPAGSRSLSGLAFEAANNHCNNASPSFETVFAILETQCGTCHMAGSSGNFNMANGQGDLVGVPSNQSNLPYVTAGDASASYLFRKIEGTHMMVGSGSLMPLGGMMPPNDIATIRAWIEAGANP